MCPPGQPGNKAFPLGLPEAWEEEREAPGISWTRSGSSRGFKKALDLFSPQELWSLVRLLGEVSSIAFCGECSPLEKTQIGRSLFSQDQN